MSAIRPAPKFDHGAALCVPPPQDQKGRRALWQWLGEEGCPLDDRGAVQVWTPFGPMVARTAFLAQPLPQGAAALLVLRRRHAEGGAMVEFRSGTDRGHGARKDCVGHQNLNRENF